MALSYVGKLQIDDNTAIPVGSTLYGVCQSDANAEVKVITLDNNVQIDVLPKGLTIFVRFVNTNTASSAKLQVPGQNAFPMYKSSGTDGAVGTSPGTSWVSGSVVSFTYDSNRWYMNDHSDQTAVKENSAQEAGLVKATGGTSGANRVWETDANGTPDWRDPNLLYLTDNEPLLQAINDLQWHNEVIE